MIGDRLRRRPFVGGVVAALTGLAGCNGDSDDSTESATESTTESSTQTDSPTPTERTETTEAVELPIHAHADEEQGGSVLDPDRVIADDVTAETVDANAVDVESELNAQAVATQSLNGTVYAAQMPGEDLSRKVRAAIDVLPAGGTVIVTPRPDDEPWTWGETLEIDPKGTGGLTLLFRGTTLIEYTGDSWAIDVRWEPADYGQSAEGEFFTLRGGHWEATGNPDGWFRQTDTNQSTVRPSLVNRFANDEKTATAIKVVNDEFFSEGNRFGGSLRKCDIGIDFVPGESEDGFTGSFQSTYLDRLYVSAFNRYGFRWREGALFQYCTVVESLSMAGTFGDQTRRPVAFDLGGDFQGSVFVSPKLEDAGAAVAAENESNDTGYRLRESMGTPPLLIAPNEGPSVDRLVVRDDDDRRLPALRVYGDDRARVLDLGRPLADPRFEGGGVTFPTQELFGAGSREPRVAGNVIYYEGDQNVPGGLYRADPANSQWVKVEDNSVTFPD